MIQDIIITYAQVLIGLAFFLFIPGYFIVQLSFKKLTDMEQILLSVLFSIMLGLIIGVFFGYDREQALRTGGFTADNLWVAELIITSLLAFAVALQRKLYLGKPHHLPPKPKNKAPPQKSKRTTTRKKKT